MPQKPTEIEPIYREIGRRIRAVRREKKMKLYQVSDAINIDRSTLGHIEAGRSRLMIHQLVEISRILGKPEQFFLHKLK